MFCITLLRSQCSLSLYEHAIWNSDLQVTYNPQFVVKVSAFRSARRRRSSTTRVSANQWYARCIRVAAAQLWWVNTGILPFSLFRSHLTFAFARSAQQVIWWGDIHILPLSSESIPSTTQFISISSYSCCWFRGKTLSSFTQYRWTRIRMMF